MVSRVDLDDAASVVPRPASVRRAVAPARAAIRRRMAQVALPEPTLVRTEEFSAPESDAVGRAVSPPRRVSVPATKRVALRGLVSQAAAAIETSRGLGLASPSLGVARLDARSQATRATDASIRPRGVRYQASLRAQAPATLPDITATSLPRSMRATRTSVPRPVVDSGVGYEPGFSARRLASGTAVAPSRHALNRITDAAVPAEGAQRRLAASPVAYVMVDPGAEATDDSLDALTPVAGASARARVASRVAQRAPSSWVSGRAVPRERVVDYVDLAPQIQQSTTASPSERVIARQLASSPYASDSLVESPVAYVESDFIRRSLERRSPAARARVVSRRLSVADVDRVLASSAFEAEAVAGEEAATVQRSQSSEPATLSSVSRSADKNVRRDSDVAPGKPTRRWRSARHAAERGAAPVTGELSPDGAVSGLFESPRYPQLSKRPPQQHGV